MTKLQAAEDRYIKGLTTANLIKLIESKLEREYRAAVLAG